MPFSLRTTRFHLAALIALLGGLAVAQPANAGFYTREEVRPMLLKADANRDGYLSRPELRAEDPSLLCGFEEADIDHNGKLDLGEFEILLISL